MKPFSFLNTRPAHQAQPLNQIVMDMGGQVFECPTIYIDWLKPTQTQLANIPHFDKVIFTSANAVEGWFHAENAKQHGKLKTEIQPPCFSGKLYAIGKATKQKGEEFDLNIQTLSQTQFDSEHFLAHAEMQNVKGEKIALIKGLGGRKLLKQTLAERGAKVVEINIYQRKQIEFCTEQWQIFLASKTPIVLISSLEGWQNLLQGLQKSNPLNQKRNIETGDIDKDKLNQLLSKLAGLVVMSQRIAEQIRLTGCLTPIQVVQIQSNQGIAHAIHAIIEKNE
ncbi:hypothetical protein JCM30760_25830 [Thiomicrorhabdus hydrogeniphila]